MKDQGGTSMNGFKGEQIPSANDSSQLDHVVEQTNIHVSLPFPDMESLERSRRAKAREAMEVCLAYILSLNTSWHLVRYPFAINMLFWPSLTK